MIPARYDATRFPGKLMQSLGGAPVIVRTYEAAVSTGLFDEVVVVTDSDPIAGAIIEVGGSVFKSKRPHESGTDRIAEAVQQSPAAVIVNVQGDTPFIKKDPLRELLSVFNDPGVQVASMMQVLSDPNDIEDPNFVKVAVRDNNDALFFSRSVIPFPRDRAYPSLYYEHIGVYAFRKQALLDFTQWPMTPLEAAEKIECLRFLEHGVPIRMVLTDYMGVEIDTPQDLERAAALLAKS